MSFLSIYIMLGGDIFRTLERIESNQLYYTTLHWSKPGRNKRILT